MKRVATLYALLTLCISAAAIAETRSYRVGVELNEYLPFYSPSKERGYTGIGYDVMQKFAHENNYAFEFVPMLVPELCLALERGVIDFKFPYDQEWRCPGLDKSDVSESIGFVPYTDGVVMDPEKFDKTIFDVKTLGTITGFTPVGFMGLVNSGQIRLVEYNNPSRLLEKVVQGEVDMGYLSIQVATYILRNKLRKPQALQFNANFPHVNGMFRLASKRHPKIISEFNQWIFDNKKVIEYIASKYGITTFMH